MEGLDGRLHFAHTPRLNDRDFPFERPSDAATIFRPVPIPDEVLIVFKSSGARLRSVGA
jgi:hypothetical protein